ncbi:YczE/YyaS/YitT family protein [Caldalkalibacillus salinus]|uniref:YczE/YyaS/YitT family protein n=1 Tax=Caldalkalibacillus salinus TaxID=2803787 RepID=UPI001F406322|nr:membrane protein [Caldalkalibacillus salinus]
MILALGITFVIKSGLGAGAWDALHVGLSETFGPTVGTFVVIVGLILIVTNALILWHKPQILPIITIFILGAFIDFWNLWVFGPFMPEPLFYRAIVFAGGMLGMAVGIAIYLQAQFALIPIDGFMLAIKARFNVSLRMGKTIAEMVALILAFIFSGPIGVGTFIITFFIGFFIQFFHQRIQGLLRPLL